MSTTTSEEKPVTSTALVLRPTAEVVPRRIGYRSPLAGGGHCLTGGVVTDPAEIAGIADRMSRWSWLRRLVTRPAPLSMIDMPSPAQEPR